MPYIDCLIGNEEDFQKVLGFEVEGVDENLSALDTSAYKKMVEKVVKAYPNVKVVGTTLREVKSGLINNWSAILWDDGKFYEAAGSTTWRSKTASAAAMVFPADSPTDSSPDKRRRNASIWARPTAPCCKPPAATPARSIWKN